jgi:hypothetical protein
MNNKGDVKAVMKELAAGVTNRIWAGQSGTSLTSKAFMIRISIFCTLVLDRLH